MDMNDKKCKWQYIPLDTLKGLVLSLLLDHRIINNYSPEYVKEKFLRVNAITRETQKYVLMQMLHPTLVDRVEKWANRWIRDFVKVEVEDD